MFEAYRAVADHTRNQTLKLVADLSDQQLCAEPAPKMNHAAWVLGHLLMVEIGFYATVNNGDRGQFAHLIDDNWSKTYGQKSVPSSDGSLYKPKQYYLDHLQQVRSAVLARLSAMTEADFNKEHPDPARRTRFPTIGHAVVFYSTWHEAYHAGQLSAWRRAQGLPAV